MTLLAERLWQSRRDGRNIVVAENETPKTIEEAIAIQQAAINFSGMPSIGFKVGSTSAEAQKALKTTEPGASPVLSDFFYTSPASIPIVETHEPAVEAEFALRVGVNLPPRDKEYSFEEAFGAIDGVAAAVEVVGSRLAGGLMGKGRLLTTMDFGANIALAIGEICTTWRDFDLAAHEVKLSVNNTLRERGIGARALGHPIKVLQWLANTNSQTGRGLLRGEIISTGTCTGLIAVSHGDRVLADFGELGSVEINFTAMDIS